MNGISIPYRDDLTHDVEYTLPRGFPYTQWWVGSLKQISRTSARRTISQQKHKGGWEESLDYLAEMEKRGHLTTIYQHAYSQDQINKWRWLHFSISNTEEELDNLPCPKQECLFGNLAPGTVIEYSTMTPCCWLSLINAYNFPSFQARANFPIGLSV